VNHAVLATAPRKHGASVSQMPSRAAPKDSPAMVHHGNLAMKSSFTSERPVPCGTALEDRQQLERLIGQPSDDDTGRCA